jgi:hypothetical protein
MCTVCSTLLHVCRHRQEIAVTQIRPPALVTEYLASGSLHATVDAAAASSDSAACFVCICRHCQEIAVSQVLLPATSLKSVISILLCTFVLCRMFAGTARDCSEPDQATGAGHGVPGQWQPAQPITVTLKPVLPNGAHCRFCTCCLLAVCLSVCRHRQEFAVSQIRPPALVTEYLASGSLRAAITRRADFLSRDSVRIKLALDAARVSAHVFYKWCSTVLVAALAWACCGSCVQISRDSMRIKLALDVARVSSRHSDICAD